MALHQNDLDVPKRGLVLNFRLNEIPIGEPGSPVLAWGLCVVALASAILSFSGLRWGMDWFG
jgi:hypothetical protein